jgi:hypothetical protein
MPYRYLAVYEVDGETPEDLRRAYDQFRWQRQERAEAVAAGRDPVVSVSDTLDPDHFLVGFFSALTDKRAVRPRGGAGVTADWKAASPRSSAAARAWVGPPRGVLAAEGARVYVADLSEDAAATVAKEIAEDGGFAVPGSWTRPTTTRFGPSSTGIDREHGKLHVLHDQVGMPGAAASTSPSPTSSARSTST